MSARAVIELDGVTVAYAQRKSLFRREWIVALNKLSLEVERGETLGIVGRNGSGKSTLLRLLAGIYRADSGRVVRQYRNVSLLSLSVGFDAALSGRDNAIISGMLMGHTRRQIQAKLDEIVAYSELGDAIDQPLRTYSTGMRARLGFSVAVSVQADLLLIDEVLGVGDLGFRKKAEQTLIDTMASDQTVVFVSHSPPQIRKLCNRVVWLDNGTVRLAGDVEQVTAAYDEFMRG
jgi:lipopolysaccharide transport system ATP-binding protein